MFQAFSKIKVEVVINEHALFQNVVKASFIYVPPLEGSL
jgi:hypothetical protein